MSTFVSAGDLPTLSFFGDASSRQSTFMVAGGFAVSGSRLAEINAHIEALKLSHGIQSEFHWSAYRGGNRKGAYEELVDYAFDLIANKHAALHIIVARFGGYDHKATPGENRDTSVNRMYFQLLLHKVARLYGGKRAIHVRLDTGNDSLDICGMRNQLCAAAYKKYRTRPNCVRSLESVASERAPIIQMADVIVGAVAAKRNNVVHTSPKGALADYILAKSGRPNWSQTTPEHARFLTVWNHTTAR